MSTSKEAIGQLAKAQLQMCAVLLVAYVGNTWEPSYDRNKNQNMPIFWMMNGMMLIASAVFFTHDERSSSRGVQLLSRQQTEEWKGWMQWAFIMYHYYRARSTYNFIRCFVSAYVWMTGFGNFIYFEKSQDFSLERALSMWLRINYFPLLLSLFLDVPLESYYVVPLHTAGFFMTMATCGLARVVKDKLGMSNYWKRNGVAIFVCLLVNIAFYETTLSLVLERFSHEYYFRFHSDKYSAWVGILSAYIWPRLKEYMKWCYGGDETRFQVAWAQRLLGVALILVWWILFGRISDKLVYNPLHPYCFWMPLAGFLMLRNSSRYLCESHSTLLEFFGRITLETYVLQFHVFMNHNVKNIPVVIPGSDESGSEILKFLNMLVCGCFFVILAWFARKLTVDTQTTATELFSKTFKPPSDSSKKNPDLIKSGSAIDKV